MGVDGKPRGNLEYLPYWVGIERPGDHEGIEQKDIERMKRISKKRGKQITDLIGWRYIYADIQACGYFGSRLEDVYAVGFQTAVFCMNLSVVTGKSG